MNPLALIGKNPEDNELANTPSIIPKTLKIIRYTMHLS